MRAVVSHSPGSTSAFGETRCVSLQAYGARPLKRAVANTIESVLSDALLHQQIVSGDTAYLDCDSHENVFVSTAPAVVQMEPLRNSIVHADGLLKKITADFDVVNA